MRDKKGLAEFNETHIISIDKKGNNMDKVSELKDMLGVFFKGNKAKVTCFTQMLLALFSVRTVNLREIAVAFNSDALIDSRYKRIKRFFARCVMDTDSIARWVFHLFFSLQGKVYLTLDRTNWFLGKSKINVLTLAIAYEGAAIPVLWEFLDKAGNASAAEHQAILERFIRIFGKDCIECVLADREFASGDLFHFFNQEKIPFAIRIKEDSIVRIGKKSLFRAEKIFCDLNPKTKKTFEMRVEIYGQTVCLAGSRSERGELMIVATNRSAENAIAVYLRRWEIEVLFSCLKTKGFRFEDTHLTHLDRISKLMGLLVIGFAWSHKIGEWRAATRPIPFCKHRDGLRPQHSFFRYGFDLIRDIVLHISTKAEEFERCLAQLTPQKSEILQGGC